MKQIMCEDYNDNIDFIKEIFYKIGLRIRDDLAWSVSTLDSVPVDSDDYSGIGAITNNSRQRVYLFQQRILNEHTVIIGHRELMNLFDDIRTIYEGIFAVIINGHQNKISVFDGEIISIQGDIEDYF